MKIESLKKIVFLFSLLVLLSFGLLNSNASAASVGDQLTSPEPGWIRYDDLDPMLKFGGSWFTDTAALNYKGTQQYTKTGTYSFKFTGNAFRLIASSFKAHESTSVEVTTDGIAELYSGVKLKDNRQVILYEKLNLPYGEHTVTVKNLETAKNVTIDAIDLNIQKPSYPINLVAIAGDGQVSLNWNQIKNAESYIVRFGTESGNYTETVNSTKDEYGNFVIPGLTNGTTYYFVVTAIVNGIEFQPSNEASAIPQGTVVEPEQPSSNRAILVVTMNTGLEKEFDLSMQEVNSFIDWYETKQAGSGKASYAIDKHDNNRGPFKSRKDYVLFDRILTFEVSEY
ncbi:fibronectin type III domain-containing protein [Paenibacillus sp. RRE4]|uniref:fibronectin type III domain-containing protein n=1 Tax=Paenibacillus sp. RRE4 TaxID=2962587 RepID=UPI002881B783|nr:fibronectin type III domain-containing protein [Paenibacillus sp. RRE4]MDT0123235.1 fibronectin type III domain-containing protein [Paenibacillus sp. RRE4]